MRQPSKTEAIPYLAALFAVNLQRYRKRMGLTRSELAARAGYTSGHIFMLESGTRQPSFAAIEHLANALNVRDPRLFFRGGGKS